MDFFNGYRNEENCNKLDHKLSHINYQNKSAFSLDMICEINDVYQLISFASPRPTVMRVEKDIIRISKIDHDLTVINFKRALQEGVATLYFQSVEDAKNFNRNVYPLLKGNLLVIT